MAFKIIAALALVALATALPQDGYGDHHAKSSQSIVIHHTGHKQVEQKHEKTVHKQETHHEDSHKEHHVEYYSHPKYEFSYKVVDPHTGDKKSQHESRDGDVVKGVYSLHEPDGTIRIVEYHADKHSGFVANVKREGHAIHTESKHHY